MESGSEVREAAAPLTACSAQTSLRDQEAGQKVQAHKPYGQIQSNTGTGTNCNFCTAHSIHTYSSHFIC